MDPKLIFWTAAFANLTAVCGFAIAGVRHVRRGEVARHRRSMKIASLLVLAFLASYALKIQFLGRENMAVWSTVDVWVLRIHELFVMQMVVGGGIAWIHARKLLGTRLVTHDSSDPVPDARPLRIHRLAGRAAVIGSLLGWAMAVVVLIGMFSRAFAGSA